MNRSQEGRYICSKTSTGSESAGNQKERKTEANLKKKTVLEEAGKCGETWGEVKRLAGN